jgi:PAS domain S-box-containing protein
MLRQADERAQERAALTCGHRREAGREDGRETGQARWRVLWAARARRLGRGAGLAVVLACVYYLAARFGLALLSEAQGVPVFWPAAGVAAGALIALGPRARVPIAIGVLAATVVGNLLVGRPAWAALWLGLCNVGEALLTAWLVDRWCGRPFLFDDWRGMWGLLAAAALASAGAAFAAAVVMHQLPPAASLQDTWRIWAAADGLGIVIVAPLLVGLYHLAAEPMRRGEALEGTAALALLAAVSSALFTARPGSLFFHVPTAVLFPFFLWIGARCRPVFAAAAALVGSAVLIGATTYRLGPFADGGVAIPTVQMLLLVGSLCALSLSTLFAERRRSEAALRESSERLRLALAGADLGVWSVDLKTGALECDERNCRINGHDPSTPPRTLAEARRQVHPDDLPRLDTAFAVAHKTGTACRAEYRVRAGANLASQPHRWAAMEGSVVNDAAGRPVRLLGVTRDITERKLAEQALAERTAQLALAGRAGLVGSYAYDVSSGMIQISPGFAAIYGMPEDTAEIDRKDWRERVHPDDFAVLEARRGRTVAARQREMLAEYRIRRPDGEVRWIEQRTLIDYDADGDARRAVGVDIDMTERKRDEEHKSLLVAELDHRVKNVLAVVSALLARSQDVGGSAAELMAALDGRIKSMAIAHELLSDRKWQGLPLGQLIKRELAPYATTGNVEVGGDDVVLKAEAGQALAMVVHELVTNAAKYGALSVERGRVSVRWRLVSENGSGAHLAIDWQETGGPQVAPSSRVGYGTRVIRDLIPYELAGTADLAFLPEGIRCRMHLPIRWLATGASPLALPRAEADPVVPGINDRSSVSDAKAAADAIG